MINPYLKVISSHTSCVIHELDNNCMGIDILETFQLRDEQNKITTRENSTFTRYSKEAFEAIKRAIKE